MAEFDSTEFNASQFNDSGNVPTPGTGPLVTASFAAYLSGPGIVGGVM